MKNQFSFLQPPVFSDEEKNRGVYVLHILLIYLGVIYIFGGALGVVFFFEEKIISSFVILAGLVVLSLSFRLNWMGHYRIASQILSGFLWLTTTFLVSVSGGPRSLNILFYLSVTAGAGALLGTRAATVYAVTSGLVSLLLLLVNQTGLMTLPDLFPFPPLSSWFLLVTNLSLILIPLNITLNELSSALRTARAELEERKKIEKTLQTRERILQAANFAGEQFLASPDWKTNLNAVLARLGEATGASHVYIFKHHPGPDGEEVSSLRFEWTAPGQTPGRDNPVFQNTSIRKEKFPLAYERKSQGLPLIASRSTLTSEEIDFLLGRDVLALLEMPIFVNGHWWGTVGFDDHVHAREWSLVEVDALKVVVNVLSAAIERQMADTARQAIEARFRAFMETSPSIAIIKDEESRYIYCNPQVEKLFGMPIDKIIGKTEYDLFPPEAAERFTTSDLRVLHTGVPQVSENAAPTPEGEMRNWWVFKFPLTDPQGQRFVGLQVLDITDRKQAEQEREDTLNLLTNVINATPDLIFVKNIELRTILCNETFSKALGKPVEEIYGHTDVENGWDLELVYGNPEKGIRGFRTDDLDALAGNVVVNPHDPANIEGEIRIFDTRKLPLRDNTGKIIGVLGVARDVTERIQVEEEVRRLNTELEERVQARTAELEAANHELEAFSYSISHDLRAPLRAINGFSGILLQEYSGTLPPEGQHYLQRVHDSAQRMGQLVDDLLAFSRLGRQELRKTLVDPTEIVIQVLEDLKDQFPGHLPEVIIEKLPVCHADPSLLYQVYANLLNNAFKFTQKKPQARIEIGSKQAAGGIIYYVRDNGAGFDEEYVPKLFGVFQRLHQQDEFEGTGIGLANVKRIITRHGGRIWAKGYLDQGATFYFTF